MTEETGEIQNTVEGPQHKVEIHISAKDFLDAGYPSHPPAHSIDWLYEKIEDALPEGELKKAFSLSRKERTARMEEDVDLYFVDGSADYAFRGTKRKSDGTAMWQHEEADLERLNQNIYEHGIVAQGSEGNILPGMIWDAYAVPTHIELKEDGVNVMEVIVYRNQPFVLPTKNGEDTTTLVNLSNLSTNGKKSEISVKEAKEKGYPTLRDLLVGQIEVYFD